MMNKKTTLTLFLSLFFLIGTSLLNRTFAQLQVDESLTPEQMVDLLLGGGVTASNITYKGAVVAEGRFWGETNLGIDSGLVLTSGRATNTIGPNTNTGVSSSNGEAGDPDLTSMANDPTHDASVLEFDFIPQSSNLQFSYVFGSDEYPEFVNDFNDAFGFFISGPGINGTFSNNSKNIALIPGSDPPVYITIDNVNNGDNNNGPCMNCEYYYNNTGGQTIEYDGFTKGGNFWPVLRAVADVTPCSTYHIKLAVGDAVDFALDSGVFLEANSFSAVGISSQTSFSSQYLNDFAVEDCNNAQIKFSLADHAEEDFVIPLTIGGSAENGVDYDTIPDSVVIQQGYKNAYLNIVPFYDTIIEAYETVTITFNTSLCEPNDTTLVIKIYDRPDYYMEAREDTTIHCADPVELFTLQDGGMPPYFYNWYVAGDTVPFDTTANPLINPYNPTEFIVHQWDACGDTLIDTVFVDVIGPTAGVSADTSICLGDIATLTATGGDTYLWSTGDTTQTIQVSPATETTYIVTVYDDCNNTDADTVTVFVNNPQANAGEDVDICIGESATLTAGGGLSYEWSTGETTQSITVIPGTDECYIVYVTDACDNVASDTVCVFVNDAVVANAGEDQNICFGVSTTLTASGGVEYLWSTGDESQSIEVSPEMTTTYYVTVIDGCEDEDSVTVFVDPLPEVTANTANDLLCYGDTVQLQAGGADEYFWSSTPADPSLSGQETSPNPLVSPTAPSTTYTLLGSNTETGCENTTTLIVQVKEPLVSDFNLEAISVCTGDEINVYYTGNATGAASFDWSFDGGTANGSGAGPYSVSWTDSGDKTISLKVYEDGCESDSSFRDIKVNPTPEVDFVADTTEGCVPASFSFYDSTLSATPDANYHWEFGDGSTSGQQNPIYTYSNAGDYTVSLQVMNGVCKDVKTLENFIRVHDNPEADFSLSPSLTSIKNPEISLSDLSSADAVNWIWNMGDGSIIEDIQNPTYAYQSTGTFNVLLLIENIYGCTDSTSKTVTIKPHPNLYAPNAFRPGSTQGNERFVVRATGIEKFNMVIYTRWGEKIFETDNISEGWDGKLNGEIAPMGTYIYQITYTNNLGQNEEVTGTVSLVK
ncbi:MAG: choice-of-anchor L domain-containing protein [Bacteroidota bacterium]|nr:choice-of-anchor L domain-containing protein [Bacteroidota bacterium]